MCCDCGNPSPQWASINLGITLCIACSGVHRSLGVHHSKVRSLTLDAWEPEIIKVMMELGNRIVNRVYEARVDDSVQRATDNCDDCVRETWIKAKYVEKRFVLPIMDTTNSAASVAKQTSTNSILAINNSAIAKSYTEVNSQKSTMSPSVARRWSVRRLRRRPKNKSRTRNSVPIDEDDAKSTKSNVSVDSVFVVGKELGDIDLLKDELALSSDQESTAGEDDTAIGIYYSVIIQYIKKKTIFFFFFR